ARGFEEWQGQTHVEANYIDDFVAHFDQQFPSNLFNLFGSHTANFLDKRERKRKHRRATANEKCLRNNERQGNLQREAGTEPDLAANLHFPVERVDAGLHYVQAYAAPCQFCLFAYSGKPRREKEIAQVALAHLASLVGSREAALERTGANSFKVNSPAIIFHFDKNVIAAMIRADNDSPLWILPVLLPVRNLLNSVRNRITDDMN